MGKYDLATLRHKSRFDFDLAGKGLSALVAGAVEPVVAADDAGYTLVAKERNGRRAAELCG